MGKKLIVVACAATAFACTSAPPPRPAPVAASDPVQEYREALEETQASIAAREETPRVADARALASIEIPSHPSIDGALRYFSTKLHGSIQTSLERSSRYKTMIDEVLDEHRLPRALAWLPVIESAFLPGLTSSAGARGIWQFMPATAREYGLRVDWWIDERADPELSTRAAARYLQDLHRIFDDWSLALAAYNCGPGRVERTLDREGADTFWELLERSALPKETRGYVPTFWATLLIAGDPEVHGFELPLPAPDRVDAIEVEGPARLDFVAALAGVDAKTLREMNPQLTRGLVPPGPARLRVPSGTGETVLAAARRAPFDDPDLPVTRFRVRPGDSIASLARLADAPKPEILAMNALRSDRLRAGTEIYLPLSTTDLSAAIESRRDVVYVVARGDTLYDIAHRHGIPLGELLEINGLDRDTIIHPGDEIRVSRAAGVLAR
ncbi:MAG: transglycosylase SLT domain-containing protein [Thermoanaerobaculia bacterium]